MALGYIKPLWKEYFIINFVINKRKTMHITEIEEHYKVVEPTPADLKFYRCGLLFMTLLGGGGYCGVAGKIAKPGLLKPMVISGKNCETDNDLLISINHSSYLGILAPKLSYMECTIFNRKNRISGFFSVVEDLRNNIMPTLKRKI